LNRVWPVNPPAAPAETVAKVPQLAKKALFTASAALESGATALAIFFLALFLAWDPDRWLRSVAELWPGPWVEERIELFRKIGVGLRSYLFTLAIYIVAMGVAWSLVGALINPGTD
jgi:predicted PurR-regulated permease PerM